MKIKRIKFFNAIKCGPKEYKFIDCFAKDKDIGLVLKGNLIQVTDNRNKTITYTSMFNTVWLEPEESFEEFKD